MVKSDRIHVSYYIWLIFMVKLVAKYANRMAPMVKWASFYPSEKTSPFGPGHKKSLSKDGDVIEPQKRCEETWVVANGANIFLCWSVGKQLL